MQPFLLSLCYSMVIDIYRQYSPSCYSTVIDILLKPNGKTYVFVSKNGLTSLQIVSSAVKAEISIFLCHSWSKHVSLFLFNCYRLMKQYLYKVFIN